MLLEGAIRHGREAEVALRRGDVLAADVPCMRMIDIISELLVGVRQAKTELNRKIAELYLYLFRLVGEAKVNDDPEKLSEALTLLGFERQTWQMVCDKLGAAQPPAAGPARSPVAPVLQTPHAPSLGISFEA
jgi:flagellin-specific chaperone FliS